MDVTTFRDLCTLLCPDPTLVDEVLLALDSPTQYRQQFFDRRAARHTFRTPNERAWIAILDGLIDRRTAVEVDHRDSAFDLADALRDTAPVATCNVDLSQLTVSDLPIPAATMLANELLADHGLALVMLRINPVDLPVVIVAADAVQEIVATAAKLDLCAQGITDHKAQARQVFAGARRIAG